VIQNNNRVLWALIAALLLINSIMIVLLLRQYAENTRQRAELARQRTETGALLAQRETLLQHAAEGSLSPLRVIPPSTPGAFGGIKETDLPGRYRWIDGRNERGVVALNSDHTFSIEGGPANPAYRWKLTPDQLILEFNRITAFYTNVESPGIYLGARTDKRSQRLERLE
jgi:hypothetical protein